MPKSTKPEGALTITGLEPDVLVEAVTRRVLYGREYYDGSEGLEPKIEAAILKLVNEKVGERIEAIADRLVEPRIEAILNEGWQPTDTYGNPSGDKKSLSTMVREHLVTGNTPYNGNRTRIMDAANDEMRKAVADVVKAHAKTLRDTMTKDVAEELRKSIVANLTRR